MKKITVLALCAGSWLLPLSSAALAQGRGPMGDGPPPGGPRFEGPDGGPRGGMRGDGPRGGGMRAMGEKGSLMRIWRGIGRLEERGTPLSKAQAKRVVALLVPLSKKPTMTQAEAKSLRPKLEAILTAAQQNEFGPGPRGFGGPPFGDGPRRGGPEDGGPDGRGPRGGGGGRGGDGPPGGFGPDDGPGGRRGMRGGGPGDGGPGGRGPEGRGPRGPQLTEAQRAVVRVWMDTSNPFYAPTGNPRWKQLPAAFQQDEARRYKENRATLEALSRQSR